MEEPQTEEFESPQYTCPSCGHVLEPVAGTHLLSCPNCGEQTFVGAHDPEPEAESETHDRPPDEAELSELRIRQVTSLRRGLIRSQSWWIIGAGACLVGAAQLVWMIITGVRSGLRLGPIGDGLAAIAALMILTRCVRRAVAIGHEIKEMRLPDPETPPDLTSLSDGSQRYSGLGEMMNDGEA